MSSTRLRLGVETSSGGGETSIGVLVKGQRSKVNEVKMV